MACPFDRAHGLNTLTSKNCSFKSANPETTETSSLELLSMLAELCAIVSPDNGCRCGSTETLWQTSDSKEAVMSLTSLCLIEGNPPVGQDRA